MHGVVFIVVASLLAFVPGQSRKSMAVQSLDACSGLSEAECCAQTLRLKGFKALGERLPDKAAKLVDLTCKVSQRSLPPTACRAITIARGFGHDEASSLCAPAKVAKRCKKDKACKACTRAMGKLAYGGSSPACLAVTYIPKGDADANVVVISEGGTPQGNAVLVKKRTVIKQQ